MNDLINGTKIDIDCDCGAVVAATLGKLRRSPILQCPRGHTITFDGRQFDRDSKSADRALGNLSKSLDDFGR